jgi:hypothetical protein
MERKAVALATGPALLNRKLKPIPASLSGPHPQTHALWWGRLARGLAILATGLLLYTLVVLAARPWYQHWGATDTELSQALPGDQLVPQAGGTGTRAITVNAPAPAVWPWLVQMGQGRGGLYSYDWLENLFGCDIQNADRIIPAYQSLKLGDPIRIYPEGKGPPPFIVAELDRGHALVLGETEGASAANARTSWAVTWAFVLNPVDAQHTRLLIRWRWAEASWANTLLLDPITFFMEQRMLRGLKERAEQGIWEPLQPPYPNRRAL